MTKRVSVAEASRLLGVAYERAYRLAAAGRLGEARREGARVTVPVDGIEAFVRARGAVIPSCLRVRVARPHEDLPGLPVGSVVEVAVSTPTLPRLRELLAAGAIELAAAGEGRTG